MPCAVSVNKNTITSVLHYKNACTLQSPFCNIQILFLLRHPGLASCSDVQHPEQAAWVAHVALVQAVHQALLTSAELESRLRYVYAIRTSLKLNPMCMSLH